MDNAARSCRDFSWLPSNIKARDAGHIRPATASEYMRNCISFYRWVRRRGLLSPTLLLWKDKRFLIRYFDQVGFERTLAGTTTDLGIPNRQSTTLLIVGEVIQRTQNRALMCCMTQNDWIRLQILNISSKSGLLRPRMEAR